MSLRGACAARPHTPMRFLAKRQIHRAPVFAEYVIRHYPMIEFDRSRRARFGIRAGDGSTWINCWGLIAVPSVGGQLIRRGGA
jgi:hypothetical protein